jgi:hypothetical protein
MKPTWGENAYLILLVLAGWTAARFLVRAFISAEETLYTEIVRCAIAAALGMGIHQTLMLGKRLIRRS